MPQGWDFGALGVPMGSFFFKHGHVAYQIDGDYEQNRMQVTFHPRVKLVTLGRGPKVKYHSHVNFKDFYTKLFVCVLTNKR